MHYLGSDCDNYGKSLKGQAPHSLVFNTFSFICIFTKPQDQNGRKRWYIVLNSPALNWYLELTGLNILSDQIQSLSCELVLLSGTWHIRDSGLVDHEIFALLVFILAPASQIHQPLRLGFVKGLSGEQQIEEIEISHNI